MADTRLPIIQMRDEAEELASLIKGEVRTSHHDRMLYSTDASIYQVEPLCVVIPQSTSELETIVKFAHKNNLPVLPRGGGTSLAGQTVNRAVIVDLSVNCRKILEVDENSLKCSVEPGVVLDNLNLELANKGLMFGPDVATSTHATIGGMIGNNSSGAHSILYGRTVDNLLAIDAVLADGTQFIFNRGASESNKKVHEITRRVAGVVLKCKEQIKQRFPKTLRHVDGYNLDMILDQIESSTPGTFDQVNLAHLLCGSEGTLAWTTKASLKLVKAPKTKGLAIVAFNNIESALDKLTEILKTSPAAVELLDDVVITMARENSECRKYVELLPSPAGGSVDAVIYVEYFEDNQNAVSSKFEQLEDLVAPNKLARYTTHEKMSQAWTLRKSGEPLLHSLPGKRKPLTFIEDTAVEPEKLASFVREFKAIVSSHGTTAAYYAHASVGCLHIRPLVDLRNADDLHAMEAIAKEVTDLVVKYGGALSGEHGDGRVRSHLLERFYGSEICDAFWEIKKIFDPENKMNPGIIVDSEHDAMRSNLRVNPDDTNATVPAITTFYNYEHGFAEAVEQCNGAGICRKTTGGTMCPSYRATLDERHATRGRGNALRLAITGQLSGVIPDWSDVETLKTLDLCLSCKACKAECPSNVDVARLKAEYFGQQYKSGISVPFASKITGRIRRINTLGSALYPLANAVLNFPVSQSIIKRMMDVDPRRSLPLFSQSLYKWMHKKAGTVQPQNAPVVILFPDCFTTFNESHIGKAAVCLLEKLGYRVVIPKLGCCGRSLISVGMLEEAQATCQRTAIALEEILRSTNAVAILGIEPSCISAIRDDWLDLKMNISENSVKEIAFKTMLVDEFVERQWQDHPNHINSIEKWSGSSVILHGHCHQKALWGMDYSIDFLKRIAGQENLTVLDSGCCGLAGSFGYSRKRYEISMKIGEQSLFQNLREQLNAVVVASGTSCRHQIKDGTGSIALHPVELALNVFNRN